MRGRKNSYIEQMCAKGGYDNFHRGEIDAIRAYQLSQDLKLNYPLVTETFSETMNVMLTTFRNAHIGKFYYACPSTSANDEIAVSYMTGWRICDVIPTEVLLVEKSYKTCSKFVLLLKRVD